MYKVYCAATGEQVPPEQNEQYKESVLELDSAKKIVPFRLALNDSVQFLYEANKFASETNTPLNSQPATLESLVNHSSFLNVQNIDERLSLIVNEAKEICQVTETRFAGCGEKNDKRSIIQAAKDTLVSYIREKTFKHYCDLIEEHSNSFSFNSQYVNDLSFESIKDELTQNKTVNNCDLMNALKLDEKVLSNLITNVKSQQQMINLNQSKTYILDQLNEISGRDDEQIEELSSLYQRMQSLIANQREKIQILLSDYESVKLTNDDLQFYSFEYQARNLHEEILNIENSTRENQSIYLLKDYASRVLLNQQMLKVCERATLILLMMRFFNQSKEGGALEKLVFLSKLPDINRQLMDEIDNRRENFGENLLIKNFRNFTESVKKTCEEENDRRENVENRATIGLSEIQLQELKSIIPGIIGERIPIHLIVDGLAKLERSISRTMDKHLPQSNSSENDEENDFFLISKPSENMTQSSHDLSNMTMSALIDYADRKTGELSKPSMNYQNADNEIVDEVPTQLYQSVIQSDDYSQLQNTILLLKQEVESLNDKLKDRDTQLFNKECSIQENTKVITRLEDVIIKLEEEFNQLRSDLEEKEQVIQRLNTNLEDFCSRVEHAEREKLLSSDLHSQSVSQLEVTLSQLESSKKDLQEKFIKMATEFNKLDQSSKAKDEQILEITKLLTETQSQCEKLQQHFESQNEKQEQQCMDMILSERKAETLEDTNKNLTQQLEDCRNELNVVKEERVLVEKNLRVQVDELTNNVNELSVANNQLNAKITELSAEFTTTVSKLETVSQHLFTEKQNSKETDLQLKVVDETNKVLRENLSTNEEELAKLREKITQLISDLDFAKNLLEQAKSTTLLPVTNINDETEKLKKEIKELTIKAQMYETATLKSATSVTTLQKKIQEQQLALKEQEESFKLIQEQYSQLEKSYIQTQKEKSSSQPIGKTFVSLEPELNDIVIFFKGNSKDIFTAISKNANRIIVAPESINTLKDRYGDAFDKLNIVVGKIVYLEPSNPSYNPFNLNTPYSAAFIEELL